MNTAAPDTSDFAEEPTVVRLTGDLDVYTAPKVREKLYEAFEAGSTRVIVDLSLVTFVDTTGLGVLMAANARASKYRGILVVACDRRVMQPFRLTGLDLVMRVVPTLAEAAAVCAEWIPPARPEPEPEPEPEPANRHSDGAPSTTETIGGAMTKGLRRTAAAARPLLHPTRIVLRRTVGTVLTIALAFAVTLLAVRIALLGSWIASIGIAAITAAATTALTKLVESHGAGLWRLYARHVLHRSDPGSAWPVALAVRFDGRAGEPPKSGCELHLTVEGKVNQAVILETMRAVVDNREAGETKYFVPRPYVPTAGPMPVRKAEINLDSEPPTISFGDPPPTYKSRRYTTSGHDSSGCPGFPFKVSASDPEYFVFVVRTRDHVQWHLELEWTHMGKRGVTKIDDSGKPFRVTGERWIAVEGPSTTR